MRVGGENIRDEQDSVGEAIMRSVSRRLARCTKLGSCRREPLQPMAGRGIVTLLCYYCLSVTLFHCCSFHCSWLALYTLIMSAPGSSREVR